MSTFHKLVKESVSKSGVPQLIAKAVDGHGRLFLEKTAGFKNITEERGAHEEDVFWIASSTKLITAVSVLQCIERGQISLDDEVVGILPELSHLDIATYKLPFKLGDTPQASGPDGQPSFTIAKCKTAITLRMLLLHTSGLASEPLEPGPAAWRLSRGEQPMSLTDKFSGLDMPLAFEPGTSWTYGSGIDWAGEIVARLNKTTLGAYFETHIFPPLGMKSSTFHPESHPKIAERIVELQYRDTESGSLKPGPLAYPYPAQDERGGLGLYSTATDYIKLLADIISPTPKLLKPETADLLFASQLPPGSPSARALATSYIPTAGLRDLGSDPAAAEEKLGFALGGKLIKQDMPGWPKGSMSWGGYANTTWFANREKGIAGCTKSNTLPFMDEKTQALAAAYREEVWRVAGAE